jgi:hypothetical protein
VTRASKTTTADVVVELCAPDLTFCGDAAGSGDLSEMSGLPVGNGVADANGEEVDAATLKLAVMLGKAVGEEDCVGFALGVGNPEGNEVADVEMLGETVADAEMLGVTVGEADCVALGLAVGLALGVGDLEGVTVADGVRLGDGVTDTDVEGVTDAVTDADADAVELAVMLGDELGDRELEGDGDVDGVRLALGETDGDGNLNGTASLSMIRYFATNSAPLRAPRPVTNVRLMARCATANSAVSPCRYVNTCCSLLSARMLSVAGLPSRRLKISRRMRFVRRASGRMRNVQDAEAYVSPTTIVPEASVSMLPHGVRCWPFP